MGVVAEEDAMRILLGLLLWAAVASADTVITAPNYPAKLYPFSDLTGTALVTDAAYRAIPNDDQDDTSAFNAAIASGRKHVIVPPGVFDLCAVILNQTASTDLVIEGSGPSSVLRATSGCGGTNMLKTDSTYPFARTVTLRNVKLQAAASLGSGALLNVNGSFLRDVTVEGIECDISAGGICVATAGLQQLIVRDSRFYGDCNNVTANDRGVQVTRGSGLTQIERNTFECLYDGTVVDAVGPKIDGEIRYTNNTADGFWWLQQALYANVGATVTYTATVITDSAAAFATIPAQTTVRVLPVRDTGTVTNIFGTKLRDTGNDFASSGVQRGDLVRTAAAFATVMADAIDDSACTGSGAPYEDCTGSGTGTNEQTLWVDGWRDATAGTTYGRPVAAPAVGTTFTVYRVLIGHRTSNTATTVTCGTTFSGFHDMEGNAVTPSTGDLYEVSQPHPNYLVNIEAQATRTVVASNMHRRSWSDCFGSSIQGGTLVGNVCEDGQDGCFTVGGGSTMVGNIGYHCGATCIFVRGAGNSFTANQCRDNRWVNGTAGAAPGLGACFDINESTGNTFVGNTCARDNTDLVLATYGTALRGSSTGNAFALLTSSGHATGEIHIAAASTGATFDARSVSGTVTDAGASPLVEVQLRTDSPATCAADRDGERYWDASLNEACVCNSVHGSGARWCQVDGGGCTSSASCG